MKTTKTQRSLNSSGLRRAATRADTLVNGHFDLALALGITIVTVALVFVPYLNGTFLRPVLGLVFVLLVPGYVFIAAFFPRKEDMSDIERIALSFGFSIGTLGLIGIGLNYTPWLIRLEPAHGLRYGIRCCLRLRKHCSQGCRPSRRTLLSACA